MVMTIDELESLLRMGGTEDEHLEFKEAKEDFTTHKLFDYFAALATEGGGKLILGISRNQPRRVVGTQAFRNIDEIKGKAAQAVRLRVDIDEILHPQGRVLVFYVPPAPPGWLCLHDGRALMRRGGSLVTMTPDVMQRILSKATTDYSAVTCPGANVDHLDPRAIDRFRESWMKKSGNSALASRDNAQLLRDAELIDGPRVTFAALILLGREDALRKFLAQTEVIFEYRSSEGVGSAQERIEYRGGFLLFMDDLWSRINKRNDLQHFQDGLFVQDIPTFTEGTVREAILNAVAHRDYRDGNSVFIRQFPRRIEVASPGGFLPGITSENILWAHSPRNRRIAEVFQKCGLVERAGQGVDRMFEDSIRDGKLPPDFSGTDEYKVFLTLWGEVQDRGFLRFLEEIGRQRQRLFSTHDLLVLDLAHRGKRIPDQLKSRLADLADEGIVEKVGRTRGVRYILSRRFYDISGRRGVYTRRRGLDRETNKELLARHIMDNVSSGSKLAEMMDVLPALKPRQIQALLRELRAEGRIRCQGCTKGARWFPARH